MSSVIADIINRFCQKKLPEAMEVNLVNSMILNLFSKPRPLYQISEGLAGNLLPLPYIT